MHYGAQHRPIVWMWDVLSRMWRRRRCPISHASCFMLHEFRIACPDIWHSRSVCWYATSRERQEQTNRISRMVTLIDETSARYFVIIKANALGALCARARITNTRRDTIEHRTTSKLVEVSRERERREKKLTPLIPWERFYLFLFISVFFCVRFSTRRDIRNKLHSNSSMPGTAATVSMNQMSSRTAIERETAATTTKINSETWF